MDHISDAFEAIRKQLPEIKYRTGEPMKTTLRLKSAEM